METTTSNIETIKVTFFQGTIFENDELAVFLTTTKTNYLQAATRFKDGYRVLDKEAGKAKGYEKIVDGNTTTYVTPSYILTIVEDKAAMTATFTIDRSVAEENDAESSEEQIVEPQQQSTNQTTTPQPTTNINAHLGIELTIQDFRLLLKSCKVSPYLISKVSVQVDSCDTDKATTIEGDLGVVDRKLFELEQSRGVVSFDFNIRGMKLDSTFLKKAAYNLMLSDSLDKLRSGKAYSEAEQLARAKNALIRDVMPKTLLAYQGELNVPTPLHHQQDYHYQQGVIDLAGKVLFRRQSKL